MKIRNAKTLTMRRETAVWSRRDKARQSLGIKGRKQRGGQWDGWRGDRRFLGAKRT